MLSNGWHDNNEWPAKSGQYYVITVLHVPNPEECPDLVVRDGDTVIDTDYFDADNQDWNNNPVRDFNDGWEVVAWKEIVLPMLPTEYANAVMFCDLPARESYEDEKKNNK